MTVTSVPASIYSEIPYGTNLYGELGVTAPPSYLVEPFLARSVNYDTIAVSWNQPTATASRWRLLSNRYGYPVDQNDGAILLDSAAWPGNFFLDTNVIPGAYQYYGIYALVNPSTGQWQRCGVTACLAVQSFGTTAWLTANLPAYFTDYLDGELTTDAAGNTFLTQFLTVLAWGFDYLKTQYQMAADHLNDPMAIPIGDLMNLASELGMGFDPMISTYLERKAARNWAHVMQWRGTLAAIGTELDLATGFEADLQLSPNLMLEDDQAKFPDPIYPPYDPSIAYRIGERVSYGDYWYVCMIAGTKGVPPTGTSSNNANWTCLVNNDEPTGLLVNPNTGWINTWEAVYPAVTNGAAPSGYNPTTKVFTPGSSALNQGIGIVNPANSALYTYNDLKITNLGTTQDLIVRSVSRTLTDMDTTTTTWAPDPIQAIHDGVPVPWVLSTQAWDNTVRYTPGDVVTYSGLPFVARRASTGSVPPATFNSADYTDWYPLSPNMRLPLMVSAYTSQNLNEGTDYSVPVTPFVDWYDSWGYFISRCYARTPTAGTPGIPDQLAFDSFTKLPGPTISGRTFDNAYAHNWLAQDSDFRISGYAGGVAYPATAGTRAMALTTGPANGQVGVTFVTAASGSQHKAVVFRFSDENDYWKATTSALIKKVSGSFTTVATYSTAAQPGDRLVVQMNGSALTVLLNGTSVATATDAFNDTATSHGLVVE